MTDSNMEKTVTRAKGRIPYVYQLSAEELTILIETGMKSISEAVILAYDYGFVKGTRAKHKKKVPVL